MSSAILHALIQQLVSNGSLDTDDIGAIAETLEAEGAVEDALLVRGAWAMAHQPDPSEWRADRARARFRVVDGGNEPE